MAQTDKLTNRRGSSKTVEKEAEREGEEEKKVEQEEETKQTKGDHLAQTERGDVSGGGASSYQFGLTAKEKVRRKEKNKKRST
jgi:hypothetical protein